MHVNCLTLQLGKDRCPAADRDDGERRERHGERGQRFAIHGVAAL